MKKILVQFFFTASLIAAFSQEGISQFITSSDKKKLQAKEDSLKEYAKYMITSEAAADIMISDSVFTRILVRTLQIKNSFYYPFDSVFGISKIYAPDTFFRLFTWNLNLRLDDYYSRQKGAIQLRTKDGSLKLIPLTDSSEFAENPDAFVGDKRHWIGAIYYNIIKTQYQGKNYYTLFGLDQYSPSTNKKWIEVMYFNEKNEPVFGGPFFSYAKDSIPKASRNRLGMEFKKDARVLANYIPDMQMILVDHLISESDQPELPSTMVPDGDNEGYKWENGKWMHIEKVFNYKIDMRGVDPLTGKPPVGDPLFDSKGNKDEKKLQEKSDQNKVKKKDNNDY